MFLHIDNFVNCCLTDKATDEIIIEKILINQRSSQERIRPLSYIATEKFMFSQYRC